MSDCFLSILVAMAENIPLTFATETSALGRHNQPELSLKIERKVRNANSIPQLKNLLDS